MTAAALRRPGHLGRIAAAELRLLLHSGYWLLLLFAAMMATAGGEAFENPQLFVSFVLFVALIHGRGAGRRPTLDEALAVDPVSHALLRAGLGALVVSVVVRAALAVHVAGTHPAWTPPGVPKPVQHPEWFPVVLTMAAVTFYLVGSAVVIVSDRPGRHLAGVFLAGILAGGIAEPLVQHLFVAFESAEGAAAASRERWMIFPVLWLLLAAAGVWLAAAWRTERLPGVRRWSAPRAAASAFRQRGPKAAAGVRTCRGAATPTRLAAARWLLLAPRMFLPLLLAALLAWRHFEHAAAAEPGSAVVSYFEFGALLTAALLWPLLVWRDEWTRSDWDESQPVSATRLWMLHAAAGAAWLQIVVVAVVLAAVAGALRGGAIESAGEVPVWVWMGVPVSVIAIYCSASLATVLAERPIVGTLIWIWLWIAIVFSVSLAAEHVAWLAWLRPLVDGVLAPTGKAGNGWFAPMGLASAAVCAAALAAAIHLRVWREQGIYTRDLDGLALLGHRVSAGFVGMFRKIRPHDRQESEP